MKRVILLFAVIITFMLQLNIVKADDGNINLETGNNKFNNVNTKTISCGNNLISDVPNGVKNTVHTVYIVIQVAVPIIIVILGMIDLIKAITSQKEDDIKKAQMLFIKRLIAGALVFFAFVLVKMLISAVANDNEKDSKASNIVSCMNCFLNNKNCVTTESWGS